MPSLVTPNPNPFAFGLAGKGPGAGFSNRDLTGVQPANAIPGLTEFAHSLSEPAVPNLGGPVDPIQMATARSLAAGIDPSVLRGNNFTGAGLPVGGSGLPYNQAMLPANQSFLQNPGLNPGHPEFNPGLVSFTEQDPDEIVKELFDAGLLSAEMVPVVRETVAQRIANNQDPLTGENVQLRSLAQSAPEGGPALGGGPPPARTPSGPVGGGNDAVSSTPSGRLDTSGGGPSSPATGPAGPATPPNVAGGVGVDPPNTNPPPPPPGGAGGTFGFLDRPQDFFLGPQTPGHQLSPVGTAGVAPNSIDRTSGAAFVRGASPALNSGSLGLSGKGSTEANVLINSLGTQAGNREIALDESERIMREAAAAILGDPTFQGIRRIGADVAANPLTASSPEVFNPVVEARLRGAADAREAALAQVRDASVGFGGGESRLLAAGADAASRRAQADIRAASEIERAQLQEAERIRSGQALLALNQGVAGTTGSLAGGLSDALANRINPERRAQDEVIAQLMGLRFGGSREGQSPFAAALAGAATGGATGALFGGVGGPVGAIIGGGLGLAGTL